MAKAVQFKPPKSTSMGTSKKTYQVSNEITLSEKQHADLVEYIKVRLDFAKEFHTTKTDRFEAIDREIAGYMVLDEEDKQRQRDNAKGYGPKVHDVNIPLVATQCDEAVTFFSTVFFPEEGPYNAVTEASKEEVAKGFSRLMNKHASYFKHFSHFTKGCYSGMKYNLGLWMVEWAQVMGSKVTNATTGAGPSVKSNELIMAGNKLEFQNPYNTLLDPTVHPTELHEKGEFFATVEALTTFRLRLMEQKGEIFNVSAIVDKESGRTQGDFEASYYTEMPEVFADSDVI